MTTTEPTVKRPAKKIVYAPMYSSHGHERKTHIAVSGEGSLCGIEKRYTGLPYSQGPDYYSVEEQFLIDNPEPHRNGCLRCRKAYLKISSSTPLER